MRCLIALRTSQRLGGSKCPLRRHPRLHRQSSGTALLPRSISLPRRRGGRPGDNRRCHEDNRRLSHGSLRTDRLHWPRRQHRNNTKCVGTVGPPLAALAKRHARTTCLRTARLARRVAVASMTGQATRRYACCDRHRTAAQPATACLGRRRNSASGQRLIRTLQPRPRMRSESHLHGSCLPY